MCGFVGFLDPRGLDRDAGPSVKALSDCLVHRGPDDDGAWLDHEAGVALAFRRLAIIDLSQAGRQPMSSAGGRFVLTFNGEIYNHQDLRAELGRVAQSWKGHSDTETLLAGFELWGVEATLRRSVGMFAFALWDRQERVLTLGRDRMGEKPCYYSSVPGCFLFGSELKALRAHGAFQPEVDREAVAVYLRLGYIPAPLTIYRGVRKLPPGTTLRVRMVGGGVQVGEPEAYWSLLEAAEVGLARPFAGGDDEAKEELARLLKEAVRIQSIADVPLGAFLSGGVDSSTIVGLMQAQSSRPVRTFTIGFEERGYDESGFAKAVAEHLGTDHTELLVRPADAMAVIGRLPAMFDEPFADASAIPTYLVAELTRRHVTVSLSGDAGDELFGGYDRYHRAASTWGALRRLPAPLRSVASAGLGLMPGKTIGRMMAGLSIGRHPELFVRRLGTLKAGLASPGIEGLYREQMSMWNDPTSLLVGDVAEPSSMLTDPSRQFSQGDDLRRMMYTDAMSYLPDDVLVKVDRAAMAVSLETRVPMLDHRVVEFAWSLPHRFLVRDGKGKWLLRQVLRDYVPDALIEREKKGFGVPMGQWIRGPLRDWAEEALSERHLRDDGILRPEAIRARWLEHVSGKYDWQQSLWPVLILQSWLRHEET